MIRIFVGLVIAIMIGIPFFNTLYLSYVQFGWFKKFFHDILHMCVSDDQEYESDGYISNCKYCNHRIVLRKNKWIRY